MHASFHYAPSAVKATLYLSHLKRMFLRSGNVQIVVIQSKNMIDKKTTALVFGSFDQLHPGHLSFLLEAKKYTDELIVVLAREETIKEIKGKKPKYSEKERKQHLEITGIPTKILLGKIKDKYKIIEKIRPNLICIGYDQNSYTKNLKEELKKRNLNPKIIRLKPYKEHIFKSSKLKSN